VIVLEDYICLPFRAVTLVVLVVRRIMQSHLLALTTAKKCKVCCLAVGPLQSPYADLAKKISAYTSARKPKDADLWVFLRNGVDLHPHPTILLFDDHTTVCIPPPPDPARGQEVGLQAVGPQLQTLLPSLLGHVAVECGGLQPHRAWDRGCGVVLAGALESYLLGGENLLPATCEVQFVFHAQNHRYCSLSQLLTDWEDERWPPVTLPGQLVPGGIQRCAYHMLMFVPYC